MPLNLSYGPVTLANNANRDVGPYTVQAGDTMAVLTVLRNITNGLDASPGVLVSLKFSAPNGWFVTAGIPGGPQFFTDRNGIQHQITQNTVSIGLNEVQGLAVTANVAVSGGSVAVQGSFVVS